MESGATVNRIHHVQITIPAGSEDQARDFYCGVLGLREVEKPELLKARGGLWLELAGQQIYLGIQDNHDRHGSRAHLAYEVDDIAVWRDRLEANGAVIGDSVPIPGYERFETRDPFGNRVEFIQPAITDWEPFEDGKTIGITGTEGGTVIADEQHERGGRITLERDCLRVPYAITCTIYGWAYHTRFIADEPTAKQSYAEMKTALLDVLRLLPPGDTGDVPDPEQVEQAVADFAERFP